MVIATAVPTVVSGSDITAATALSDVTATRCSMGYWNDNFVLTRMLGKRIEQGRDDFVTASFWLRAERFFSDGCIMVDLYHSILTNRDAGYRTDLISVRCSVERKLHAGMLTVGGGIIAQGRYGGRAIQNGYHRLTGAVPVDLAYSDTERVGPALLAGYRLYGKAAPRLNIGGYATGVWRGGVGPGTVHIGAESELRPLTRRVPGSSVVRIQTGYVAYAEEGRILSPLFGRGIMAAGMGTAAFTKSFAVSGWITYNQYGREQPHFGIVASFGGRAAEGISLRDVAFP